MSKNITIKEGSVAKNFTGVEKLSTTQMNSTEKINWIPEDEVLDYVTLKELKVTANGTYKAEDKNCDGFDKVKVETSADVLPQKTITTNGEYDAMQDDGRVGYAHVTVNVPGGGGGPFTVLFLDDEGNVLKKQENVPYGGYASCTALDGTILNGLYFKGWNPVPKNVQFNMTCRPVRGDYVITPGEIADDWETIVADGGAHYPLGAYKPLVINVPAHLGFQHVITAQVRQGEFIQNMAYGYVSGWPDISAVNIACHMVKVAEGEDGSTSSWISDGLININNINLGGTDYRPLGGEYGVQTIRADWLNSPVRKWMNEDLYNALPLPLKNAIVSVNKTSKALDSSPAGTWAAIGAPSQLVDKTSIDEIWVPSLKEYHSYTATQQGSLAQCEELSGIDYSAVFVPAYSGNDMCMRTLGAYSGYQPKQITVEYAGGVNFDEWNYAQFGFCL